MLKRIEMSSEVAVVDRDGIKAPISNQALCFDIGSASTAADA